MIRSSSSVGSGLGRIVETNLWDRHFHTHSRARSCYSTCSPCEDVSECNHKETWVGCILSLTLLSGRRLMLPGQVRRAASLRILQASWPRRTSYGRSCDL